MKKLNHQTCLRCRYGNQVIKSTNINSVLRQVESRWLQILYEHVKELFSQTWLPSHDHIHHLRVWIHAKNLVEALSVSGYSFTEQKLKQLVIAAFFHDTGLTRTLDASHGKESRKICHDYLAKMPQFSSEDYKEILDAVEKHDDKSYRSLPANEQRQPDNLLTILTVSDDLDAYGAIGVYRYLEIYVLRAIPLWLIPSKIIENISKRYNYLVQNYSELEDFIKVQQKRYQYTVRFFSEMEKQYNSMKDITINTGPAGTVNLLIQQTLTEKIHYTALEPVNKNLSLDQFSINYFKQLQKECKHG
ncbi:MAG: HD domain-containing protein [Bacteroidales bacterium]|nr:HD domain-containing protein [Bacteroidales bacterium]MBN2764316.1 HD domain-containing protein [Bacteroidales bacterium]